MRTLCKKALALCVVFALALTCFVGTLSVSAADVSYNANVSVTASPVAFGDTTATAVFHFELADKTTGINEALIKLSSEIGTVSALAELVKDAEGTPYSEEELSRLDYAVNYITTDGRDIADDLSNVANLGDFFLSAKNAECFITEAFIKVTFKIGANVSAGTYAINIDAPEGKVLAASPSEDIINLKFAGGNFTVTCDHKNIIASDVTKDPTCTEPGEKTNTCACGEKFTEAIPETGHAEELTYTSKDDGTHAVDCPNCEVAFDAEDCADTDADGACDKCKYVFPAEEPECEHTNVAANKVVKFEEGVINYYTECADCGELTLASTDSSDNAATHAATVANFATYSAIELTTAGTATIKLADVEQAAIKLAYVKDDKIIANGAHSKTVPYNPIKFTSYADGVVTIDSNVTGIIIAYTLSDSKAIDAALGAAAMQRSIELLSNINYKFTLRQTSVQYNNANVFDSLYAVVEHEDYTSGSMEITTTEVAPNEELESGYYVFPYPVKAMQMGDTVVCNYYGVKNGVSYLLRVMDDYNVVAYANKYSLIDTNTDAENKMLVSDLLRYGAEVQKFFGYNTSKLVTSGDIASKLVVGSSVDLTDLEKLTSADTIKVDIGGSQTNVVGWQRSVSVEDAIKINFKLAPANFVKYYGVSQEELALKLNYIDKFGEPQTIELSFSDYDYFEDPRYVYVCDQIASSKMGTETSMEVWYQDTKLSTFHYSVESFLNENYDSSTPGVENTLGDVCKAIANYSASAVAEFG